MTGFLKSRYILPNIFVVIITVIFLQFFSCNLIPGESTFEAPLILALGTFMMLFTVERFFLKKGLKSYRVDKIVFLFIISMFLSMLMAYVFWDQPFLISFLSYRFFYIYFLYFLLLFLNFSTDRIESVIKVLFFLSILVFVIDLYSFPEPLFANRYEERRNGITIFFSGQGFTFLGAFLYLDKFLRDKKIINLVWFSLAAICLFALTQSRMNLMALAGGAAILLLNSNFRSKKMVIAVFFVAGIILYLTSSVFQGVREESNEQATFAKEDIRVLAQHYFLNELQKGPFTEMFGNGYPGNGSRLEHEFSTASSLGFWTSDVGLTGIFCHFGFVGVLAWILFFFEAFRIRKKDAGFVKAYFFTLLTTAITGYSIFDPGYMPASVFSLYLLRCFQMQKQSLNADSYFSQPF